MQEIRDDKRINAYLEQYRIRDLFDTGDIPFRLYRYEPGEMMNLLHPTKDYLKFVVEGSFDLYTVRADGVRHMVFRSDGLTFLGDLEFCGKDTGKRYQEVTRTVYTLEIPLETQRDRLKRDLRFLNYLLDTLAEKLANAVDEMGAFPDLREAMLYYIRYQCPNHTITSVSLTASRLNYSMRQTQRVLKELTQEGILLRIGKGNYTLAAR